MKATFLILFILLCFSCANEKQERAFLLEKDLMSTSILSPRFDSLLHEINILPPNQRINILLKKTCEKELTFQGVEKQKGLLAKMLPLASKRMKKQILKQNIIINQQIDQLKGGDVAKEGIRLCEELENNYSLSQEESSEIRRIKVSFLNKQGLYKESLPILFNLLKEHREAKQEKQTIEDLSAIATYFERLGDINKALTVYKEAYQIAVNNNFFDLQKLYLIPIVDMSYGLGHYREILDICAEINVDSVLTSPLCMIISDSYLQLQKPDSARLYLAKMNEASSRSNGIAFYCQMADTYISESQEDSAAAYLDRAVRKFEMNRKKHPNASLPRYFMSTYSAYASLLQQKGKIQQAAEVFRFIEPLMAIPVAESARLKKQIDALERYISFCRYTKQYKKAADLLVFRDSIQKKYYEDKVTRDTKNWTERFEIQELTYKYEEQEKEIEYTKRITAISWTVVFFLVTIAIGCLLMYYYLKKQNKQLRKKVLELITPPQPAAPPNKREPLTPQEQLYKSACKLVKTQKLFLDSTLTLDKLAEKLSTNRTSLSKAINVHAERNFNQWINKARIDYALTRIDSVKKLGTLYKEVGFLSQNTFINSFKDNVGCTPSEYLKAHRSDVVQDESVEA